MPKVTFVSADGETTTVEAEAGLSVMEAAVRNDVAGIDAECGGSCACATCHVIVDPDWAGRLDPPSDSEREMLEYTIGPEETSRLACQIELTEDLDGIRVRLPVSQQ
ncbi:MAG: 2Fe-2S ferredoxin [Rhodovulum sulfidophilum]|uniref:2Fe-2S ferredoxin n=1 Tax=Rhodovulum sulfidophilum TaxID=35806 RepID=A0A2W5PMC9_RHOSU|nr:MAG: 2Fe-2S ferredoxin [Rhodovulum sulfidophilum]